MKKILTVFLAALLAGTLLAGFAGCSGGQAAESDYIRYVSHCDNYDQIVIFRVNNRSKYFVNREAQYLTEGQGSLKMTAYEDILTTSVDAANPYSDTSDFAAVAAVSFDVYNAAANEISMFFTINTNSATIAVASETLAPGAWTNVEVVLNRSLVENLDERVTRYDFSFRNNGFDETTGATYDIYLDNFSVETTDAAVVQPVKTYEAGEVMNFDSVSDLAFLTTGGYAQFNRTAAVLSINADPNYAKNGNSLKMSVLRLSDPTVNEIWSGSGIEYEYFGIMLGADYLANIDFTDTSKTLSVDIFNANHERERLHLRIYDRSGNSAQTDAWIAPNSWGTLQISDFGQVNRQEVSYIRVMYEGLRIFNDYDLYIDNLRFE